MNLADEILKTVKALPESKQVEVLDFIKHLKIKAERQENSDWSNLSLSTAMREMENEPSPYSIDDIKESFL